MTDKYHVNPATGRPNKCYAQARMCPISGTHYANKVDARRGYEDSMKEKTLPKTVAKATYQEKPDGWCTACRKHVKIAWSEPALGWKFCAPCAQLKDLLPKFD